jgi:coenzyme F420-reducing hydrogenase delta subunit
MDKEPKILIFACNWCAYAGADLAGMLRMEVPANCRIIRVMCSGRVSGELIIRALSKGVKGVMVLGCHPGECHYLHGNYYMRRRMLLLSEILQYVGIEKERLKVGWVSAAEGEQFKELVKDMVEKLRRLP